MILESILSELEDKLGQPHNRVKGRAKRRTTVLTLCATLRIMIIHEERLGEVVRRLKAMNSLDHESLIFASLEGTIRVLESRQAGQPTQPAPTVANVD